MDFFTSLPISEKRGVIAAAVILIVGLLLAKSNIGDSATLIALLFFPLLVYGIVSGKIQEFSGPGGWGAKFQQVAAEKVTPTGLTDCIQNFQVVQKGGIDALKAAGQSLEKGKPIALTLKLGQQDYDAQAFRLYIDTLRIADHEMSVLFLDQNGRLVATAEATTILGILNDRNQSRRLLQAIQNSDTAYLRSLPGFQWETITSERTNAEALQLMREASARSMVVVDSEKRPIGIVRRDDIIARLLVELAGTHRVR